MTTTGCPVRFAITKIGPDATSVEKFISHHTVIPFLANLDCLLRICYTATRSSWGAMINTQAGTTSLFLIVLLFVS